MSTARFSQDQGLLLACTNTLSEALFTSSDWSPYKTPPSDSAKPETLAETTVFNAKQIDVAGWTQDLAVYLAVCTRDFVLGVLPPILRRVKGFAEQAFPFIVHLVLLFQLQEQHVVKRSLSEAAMHWLASCEPDAQENVKLLVNAILYLKTQPLPNEASLADRSRWLDIDPSLVAAAASRCGMYKSALLYAETALLQTASRGSRRSSSTRHLDLAGSADLLLEIFENIDDPDAYYGLPQSASLQNVLARLEHEKDGIKSLAFRGAQYDSHLRRQEPASSRDSQSLVQTLGNLGLAGLSHSLLQTQESSDGTPAALDSTFTTARRLGIWNLPTPSTSESHAATMYKAYQSIHQAVDPQAVQRAVYEGLGGTMRYLASRSLNPSALRQHLGALAALTELDDVMNVTGFSELEDMVSKFEDRSRWMMSGR